MAGSRAVRNAGELLAAIVDGVASIEIRGRISGMPMITLPPGVALRGGTLLFGGKGVRLTRDNTLQDVTVLTAADDVAILNDPSVGDLGSLRLSGVTTTGQILLVAEDAVRAGHVVADGVHVQAADVRGRAVRPHGFGVEALQGAFTLWNRQADPAVVITAELRGISAGSPEAPVRGSGVFVGGHGDWEGRGDGGVLRVSTLSTGEIHTDGGIAPGTPDLISGGVFVISGAIVQEVVNEGPVTTYGQNDMVLDNWGEVTTWRARGDVTSRGPSGIAFVNFGRLGRLEVGAPVRTYGTGARGFNVYDGSLDHVTFHSIATHGDGSTGVQVSRPLRVLEVTGDLTTEGGEGTSLVKGVQTTLKAIALSVTSGGSIDSVSIGGELKTAGDNVVTLDIEGEVGEIAVAGGITATGAGSDAVHLGGGARVDVDSLEIRASDGERVVVGA